MSIDNLRRHYTGTEWCPNTEVLMIAYIDELSEACRDLYQCQYTFNSCVEWSYRKDKIDKPIDPNEFWNKISRDEKEIVKLFVQMVGSQPDLQKTIELFKKQVAYLNY